MKVIYYRPCAIIFKKCVRFLRTTQATQSSHLDHSPNAKLSKTILDRYLCLPLPECKTLAMYIWIDKKGRLRAKSRTLDFTPASYKELPNWTYDASSTGEADITKSDMYLCPIAMYKDPIRRGDNKLVLCETFTADHKPSKTNTRHELVQALNCICDREPMFGFEQEFHFMDVDDKPYGWPIMSGQPAQSNRFYCGVGSTKIYCRSIMESHYRACLYAGIDIDGENPEANPSQWEFQVGVSYGIKAADDLWMARFLLARIAEEYGLEISYYPKLYHNWNSSSTHTNFSTKEMRAEGGINEIEKAICLLEKKHQEHIKKYDFSNGILNKLRLNGKTDSHIDQFSYGVANRLASIRIPLLVAEARRGYFEDRRPAANCDPYSVCHMLIKTILMPDK